ncbi:ankyrin repeat domain-containing protein [Rickettsia bellii]|uniref:Ankyrin repeat family protein n=1 Tax=Rickettsia bellii str. RML Mogi TaxID=1359194 RepID=A0A0F3QI66_RICBE|nr:ankyrin repeat domain-containing protein [Rickettsia bellii]KJV92280.1 ankyrin repeat family protein [Rickettsia bellii str. RML Mogi]
MKEQDNLSISQELYGTILINLKSIVQNIFPLEYNKQEITISYIVEQIASSGSIQKNSDYPELDEEIEEINQAIIDYCKYKEIPKEEENNIYKKTSELIKDGFLKNIEQTTKLEPTTELEKKYLDKLNQATSSDEKKIIIDQHKLEIEAFNKQIAQDFQKKQEDLRGNREITNVEEHKLVKEGIVTKEEIEPYLSNYPLLNTLVEYIYLDDDQDIPLVKKLFEIARNFYPNNSTQELKELMELSYKKVNDLVGTNSSNILELLNHKQISFADINNVESEELHKINEIKIKSNFKILDCVISGDCRVTLKKLIETGKIESFDKKELELVVALFEKDADTLNKHQETKLSSKVGKLLLTFHASKAYKLDDLMQFINIIDVAEELLFTATYYQNINIIKQIIETKIEISSSTLIKALYINFTSDNKEILDYLLSFKGLNINEHDENGGTLLDYAITFNKLDIVKKLLSHENIEVNKKNIYGFTILEQAINDDKLEIVKLLLSHPDIKFNEKDQLGYTSLDWVIICNKLEIFKVLMPHLDINQKNQDGYTPLEWSIYNSYEVFQTLLLRPDINVNEENQHGLTPLQLAIIDHNDQMIQALLSHKNIEVSEKNQYGTPLELVINNSNDTALKLLLSHPKINLNKTEIAEILRLHEAKLKEEVQDDSVPISNIELDTSVLGGLEEDQESYGL